MGMNGNLITLLGTAWLTRLTGQQRGFRLQEGGSLAAPLPLQPSRSPSPSTAQLGRGCCAPSAPRVQRNPHFCCPHAGTDTLSTWKTALGKSIVYPHHGWNNLPSALPCPE